MSCVTVNLEEALSAARLTGAGTEDSGEDTEFTRGICELLKRLYLPGVDVGISRLMILAGIRNENWKWVVE